jgi:hypothetical protein
MDEIPVSKEKERPRTLQFAAQLVIVAATALALGVTLRASSQFGANDISRWCTVWSLLERGTYAIDDCPWQKQTQDKVLRPAPSRAAAAGGGPVEHFYSSKPPLLPTLIAGLLYPARRRPACPWMRSSSRGASRGTSTRRSRGGRGRPNACWRRRRRR